MAFVHVEDRGQIAHLLEGAQAANAQHDLLLDARAVVAAVEVLGDVPDLLGGVLGDVGIEQEQLIAARLHQPELDGDGGEGQMHLHADFIALRVKHGAAGHQVKVVHRVEFHLPAVWIQRLLMVTLLVGEAHADERQAGVAGALHVVARKNSQAAGIDRQTIGEPVLHGEVGDQQILVAGLLQVHGRALHVGVEALQARS